MRPGLRRALRRRVVLRRRLALERVRRVGRRRFVLVRRVRLRPFARYRRALLRVRRLVAGRRFALRRVRRLLETKRPFESRRLLALRFFLRARVFAARDFGPLRFQPFLAALRCPRVSPFQSLRRVRRRVVRRFAVRRGVFFFAAPRRLRRRHPFLAASLCRFDSPYQELRFVRRFLVVFFRLLVVARLRRRFGLVRFVVVFRRVVRLRAFFRVRVAATVFAPVFFARVLRVVDGFERVERWRTPLNAEPRCVSVLVNGTVRTAARAAAFSVRPRLRALRYAASRAPERFCVGVGPVLFERSFLMKLARWGFLLLSSSRARFSRALAVRPFDALRAERFRGLTIASVVTPIGFARARRLFGRSAR